MIPRRLLVLAALVLAAIAAPARLRAQGTDVIRGQVTGPDSQPVRGATVTVTSLSGNVSRSAKTDRSGRFTVTFPGEDGDYMVNVAALGYNARRFEVKRTADQEILVADTRLTRMAAVLDAVKVEAPRDKVARNDVLPDVSGTEQPVSNAALPASSMGDLAAMAASLPGVQLVPGQDGAADGFSVLGLGADQNNTTLNGLSFGGSSLPRDAAVSSSVITTPYDVSRGGFSGAQFGIRTRAGSNFLTRGMSLNLDAPQMQWTDRAARALGQDYANASLGGVVSGPIVFDKAFYNVAYQLGRRASDAQSLVNTSALGLQTAGVSADSAARLAAILRDATIPTSVGGIGSSRLSDQGSLFGSVDVAPPTSTTGQAFNLSFNGNWNRQSPAGGFATETPAFGGERTNWRGSVQGRHSGYLPFLKMLSETTVGVNAGRSWGTPFLSLPTGRVRVSSELPDGNSVQMLSFGGSPTMDVSQRTNTAGWLNQLSWFSANNKHRVKLTSELRRDALAQDQSFNRLGTFIFNSLEELENGEPASFTRQLAARRHDASQLVGGLSLGDAWRRDNDLQVQYGVRLDANRYLDAPDRNPELEPLFGLRNDRVPDRVYVSPRVGFSWAYGTAPQIAGFDGAIRGPRAVVRGGVGVFQNMPSVNGLFPALQNTGLPGATQSLVCLGDAAPTPDWDAWLADPSLVPTQCAGDDGGSFSDSAPNATLFARDWRAPRSVRSNLQWNGPILGNRLSATVEGTYSANRQQPGMVDRNFAPVVRFTLPDEGDRPVFVDTADVVPASGAVAASGSRISPLYARVTELRSDLRSESRQLTLRLAPTRFSTDFSWGLSYVYSNVREQSRGFGGSTAGDPLKVEWGRSTMDSRHQVVYNLGYNFLDAVRVNWFGSFRSGTPFTPLIASDVNGDGVANDRAWVFDPASDPDPARAAAMQSLLDHGSRAARDCLRAQLGRAAGRNSCQGPWTSQATLSLSLNPVKFRMPRRATLSLQVANPLGAADLLLHGSDGLRGWGQGATPDASLLYVRGFDPVTRRYAYEVNQRFGATDPARSAFRAPVSVTALLRFDVGPTRERQMLTQQLDRGRRTEGTRAAEPMLRAMLAGGGLPNPMATILRAQDSLQLTGAQADSIAALNRAYTIRLDSLWTPIAREFGALPDGYDRDDAYDRYLAARERTVDMLARLAPHVKGLLTPEQRRKLPPFIASYLEPRYLASIRSGTASFTGGGMFPGGGPVGPGIHVEGAGGGERITIIRQ